MAPQQRRWGMSGLRRFPLIFASAFALLAGVMVAFPGEASATSYCGGKEAGIWLDNNNYNSIGSQAGVLAPNHSLVSCGGSGVTADSVNTVGLLLTSDAQNWVEVGYVKYLSCFIGCSAYYKVFGEWGFNGSSPGQTYYGNVTTGTVPTFKAVIVTGSYNWTIYWDPNGGTNFTLLATYNNLCCQTGDAYGEASRSGASGTDIVDHHYNMYWKNTSGTWSLFSSLHCQNDTDADYQWNRVSGYEFQVGAGPGYC
jgi:hypothetical protein